MTRATRSLLPVGLMAATLLALTSVSTAQAQKTLSWKFKEGETLQYATREASEMIMDAGGIEFDILSNQTLDTTWTVKSVASDGTATVTRNLDRIQFKLDTPFTGEFTYDSKNPDEGAQESQVWQMVGSTFEAMLEGEAIMKISAHGEVTDIELPEALMKLFEEQSEGGGRGAFLMGGGTSEDGIKDAIRRSVALLPEGAVSSDTAWKQVHEVSQGPLGTQITALNFSYGGTMEYEGNTYDKIDVKTEISVELDPDSEADIEMEITEQEGTGMVYFDAQAGSVGYARLKQTMVVEGFMMGNDIIQERDVTSEVVRGTSDDLPKTEADEEGESEESEQ